MRGRVLTVVLLGLAGCQGVRGPFQRPPEPTQYNDPRRIDNPRLPISEQERRGRDRLALPDPSPNIGPETYLEPPGTGYYRR